MNTRREVSQLVAGDQIRTQLTLAWEVAEVIEAKDETVTFRVRPVPCGAECGASCDCHSAMFENEGPFTLTLKASQRLPFLGNLQHLRAELERTQAQIARLEAAKSNEPGHGAGLPVFLSDEEVIRLKRLTTVVDLPKGDHEVRVSVLIDPARTTSLVFSPIGLPDQEPIVVPLTLEDESPTEVKPYQMELVLILDCSRSMHGEKLEQAKKAIEVFLREIRRHGFKVALVKMGGEVEVVFPLSTNTHECIERMQSLEASGGTLMTEALALTEREFGSSVLEEGMRTGGANKADCRKSTSGSEASGARGGDTERLDIERRR
jgi:hypothetical protein